jgi:hypothetical protein
MRHGLWLELPSVKRTGACDGQDTFALRGLGPNIALSRPLAPVPQPGLSIAAPAISKSKALFARRDFPRQHAELIDVPIADDHLDRGRC